MATSQRKIDVCENCVDERTGLKTCSGCKSVKLVISPHSSNSYITVLRQRPQVLFKNVSDFGLAGMRHLFLLFAAVLIIDIRVTKQFVARKRG
jgi:hypothetical protein